MTTPFDPAKSSRNRAERELAFDVVMDGFDYATADYAIDDRRDYGETSVQARGVLSGVVIIVVDTTRHGRPRIISARRANRKERKLWFESHPPTT